MVVVRQMHSGRVVAVLLILSLVHCGRGPVASHEPSVDPPILRTHVPSVEDVTAASRYLQVAPGELGVLLSSQYANRMFMLVETEERKPRRAFLALETRDGSIPEVYESALDLWETLPVEGGGLLSTTSIRADAPWQVFGGFADPTLGRVETISSAGKGIASVQPQGPKGAVLIVGMARGQIRAITNGDCVSFASPVLPDGLSMKSASPPREAAAVAGEFMNALVGEETGNATSFVVGDVEPNSFTQNLLSILRADGLRTVKPPQPFGQQFALGSQRVSIFVGRAEEDPTPLVWYYHVFDTCRG
jgi:hypothetical protein